MEHNMLGDLNLQIPARRRSGTRQRPKVRDEDRKRISLACEHCRNRKIKCTGKQPCRECQRLNTPCHYPPNSAKVVVPEIYVESLQNRIAALEKCLRDAVPNSGSLDEITNRNGIKLQTPTSTPSSTATTSPLNTISGSFSSTVGSRSPTTSHDDLEDDCEDFFDYAEAYTNCIGDSAGSTFLDQVTDFIKNTLPLVPVIPNAFGAVENDHSRFFSSFSESYHAYDQTPLPLPPTDPYTLPPKPTSSKLLEGFLRYCGPGTTAHAATGGGIFHWFNPTLLADSMDTLYQGIAQSSSMASVANVENTSLCTVNMILAIGSQVIGGAPGWPAEYHHTTAAALSPSWTTSLSSPASGHRSPEPRGYQPAELEPTSYQPLIQAGMPRTPPGMTYFARTKLLLVNPVEEATRPCLRVLALMSFYLLSAHRRDAGYMYIGLAVRMAVAHSLHRSDRSASSGLPGTRMTSTPRVGVVLPTPPQAARDVIDAEERKREFWNLYILDRYYSCLTGRPVMLSDEDIDVDLPADVPQLPVSVGLTAHVKLCKIMGDIVNKIYRVRKPGTNQRRESMDVVQSTERIHNDLESWKESLAPELRLVNCVARGRSVLLLHLLSNQLYILTTRHSLLLSLKKRSAAFYLSLGDAKLPFPLDEHVTSCALASRNNIALMKQLKGSGWVSTHCFLDYHYMFNAVVILLLVRLLGPSDDGYSFNHPDVFGLDEDDISFGTSYLFDLGTKGNDTATSLGNICIELRNVVTLFVRSQHGSAQAIRLAQSTMVETAYEYATYADELSHNDGHSLPLGGGQLHDPHQSMSDVQSWLYTGVSGSFES